MIVHFSAHISKWELVCKFGVIFHIFIISCLCSRFHVRNQWFFYSVITFSYIKCFVHSYTVDVVFTLSYKVSYQIWYHFIILISAIPQYKAANNITDYHFTRMKPLDETMKNQIRKTLNDTSITQVAWGRDHFENAPRQWETALHCKVISHWLGAYTKWSLMGT